MDARQDLAEEALATWLRWAAVFGQVMAAMFDQLADPAQLQQTLDLADKLRQRAGA
jgi:hypothetical protein